MTGQNNNQVSKEENNEFSKRENNILKLSELMPTWKKTVDYKEEKTQTQFWTNEMFFSMMDLIETIFKSKMLPVEYTMMMSYMSSVKAVMEYREQQQSTT
jgi:hypothetical protein